MGNFPLNPPALSKPFGYSHGMLSDGGKVLFIAGQPAMDAQGEIVAQGDIAGQFHQAFANLNTVLSEAGAKPTDLVKLTIFVTDKSAYLASLKQVGQAYRSFFGKHYPAITLVEVKSLYDDKALVEIEGIAVIHHPE